MSKQVESIRRMLLIVNAVRQREGITKQELLDHINNNMELYYGYNPIGERTLQRDLSEIEMLFCVSIKFNRGANRYHIQEDRETYEQRMSELLMNFDLLNAIGNDSRLSSFVLAEHHRPQHSEWLPALIKAIKETRPITFNYVDYRRGNSIMEHHAEPHYLKESNRRWYLLGMEDGRMKTFGVDRIRDLEISYSRTFTRTSNVNVAELFKDCYGIWNDERMPIEDIELRYSPLDGRFIKSVPIHHSQRILADNDEEFRIALRLRITNDFVMELLSRSKSLEVIRPQRLREEIRRIYEEAIKRNS